MSAAAMPWRRQVGMTFASAVAVVAVALGVSLSACGCKPADSPKTDVRKEARAAFVTLGYAVHSLDDICGKTAMAMAKDGLVDGGLALAKKCAASYDAARGGLLAGASTLDAWDATSEKKLACAARDATTALIEFRDAVGSFATVPQVIDDAVELGRWASGLADGMCRMEGGQ